MTKYKVIKITIRNEMGAIICLATKTIKDDDITKALIDYLKDYDIILERGDTITIE